MRESASTWGRTAGWLTSSPKQTFDAGANCTDREATSERAAWSNGQRVPTNCLELDVVATSGVVAIDMAHL